MRIRGRVNIAPKWGVMNAEVSIPDKCIFPMPDARHVRAAEAFFCYASEECKSCLAHKILSKAQEYGVAVKNPIIFCWVEKYL